VLARLPATAKMRFGQNVSQKEKRTPCCLGDAQRLSDTNCYQFLRSKF